MQLLILRHGYSIGNEKGLLSGWSDVALTDKGKQELIDIRQKIELPLADAYYSSDLSRCAHTAHILFAPHAINGYTPQFRETNFGSFENMHESEYKSIHFFKNWIHGDLPYHYNGETFEQFNARVMHGLAHALAFWNDCGYTTVGLCTHMGVIRAMLMHLCHGETTDFLKIFTPNGAGYVVDIALGSDGFELKTIRVLAKDQSFVTYLPNCVKKYLK